MRDVSLGLAALLLLAFLGFAGCASGPTVTVTVTASPSPPRYFRQSQESASATVSSNSAQKLTVTLISQGQAGPYLICTAPCTGATSGSQDLDAQVMVNSNACLQQNAGTGPSLRQGVTFADANADGKWAPGESFTMDVSNPAFCGGSSALQSGSVASVTVTVHGTVIQDNTPVVVR